MMKDFVLFIQSIIHGYLCVMNNSGSAEQEQEPQQNDNECVVVRHVNVERIHPETRIVHSTPFPDAPEEVLLNNWITYLNSPHVNNEVQRQQADAKETERLNRTPGGIRYIGMNSNGGLGLAGYSLFERLQSDQEDVVNVWYDLPIVRVNEETKYANPFLTSALLHGAYEAPTVIVDVHRWNKREPQLVEVLPPIHMDDIEGHTNLVDILYLSATDSPWEYKSQADVIKRARKLEDRAMHAFRNWHAGRM